MSTATLPAEIPRLEGVRASVLGQIDRAVDALIRPDLDVHVSARTARVAFKRARALLKLGIAGGDQHRYASELHALRDAGRLLAPLREAQARVETLDAVATRAASPGDPKPFRAIRRTAAALRDELAIVLVEREQVLWRAAELAAGSRDGLESLDEPDGDSVEGGLRRTYGAGRAELAGLGRGSGADKFHEWRKPVKALRYQLQFVAPLWPDRILADAREFGVLGDLISENHDLAELRAFLLGPTMGVRRARGTELLTAVIDARAAATCASALRLGRLVYAERPAAFGRRYDVYWRAGASSCDATLA